MEYKYWQEPYTGTCALMPLVGALSRAFVLIHWYKGQLCKPIMTGVWPLGVYFLAVLVLVAGMLCLSHRLGQRHDERATSEPYESSIVSTGSARIRFSVKFYLIAMLFVIFDQEPAFIIAWPLAFRDVGWPGYLGVLVFIGVLIAALVYEWRLGVLEWGRDHWKVSKKIV